MPANVNERLIVAADLSTRDEILRLSDELHGVAGVIKIGLQAFVALGPDVVREVVGRGEKVFLDLKLHDIPNTVQHAVAEVAGLGAAMLTVHTSGGSEMMRAAAHDSMLVLGVTILTSMDQRTMSEVGWSETPADAVVRLATLAKQSGLRGVVASPLEIRAIREACGAELSIVTPGIRPGGAEAGDQKRTMTPREAMAAGADYLVIGRPITGAANRRDAALRILEEMG